MASRTNLNSGVRRGQSVRKVKRTRISEKGKERLKKALLLFAFAVLGFSILASVVGPSIDTVLSHEAYIYAKKYGNPLNNTARDKAYEDYTQTVYNYKHSDNDITRSFFHANTAEQIILVAVGFFLMYPFISKTYKALSSDNTEK